VGSPGMPAGILPGSWCAPPKSSPRHYCHSLTGTTTSQTNFYLCFTNEKI
jgi:hypothetical protein